MDSKSPALRHLRNIGVITHVVAVNTPVTELILFYTGESRNAQGQWQLGNKASFACSAAAGSPPPGADCQCNAGDDQQGRARYGL